MKTYAVLDSNNIVENIIVASSLETAEGVTLKKCIHIDETTKNAHIGLGWNGTEFEQPPLPEPIIISE